MPENHIHHYHKPMDPKFSAAQVLFLLFYFAILILFWLFDEFIYMLGIWPTYPVPYKYVAAFYDYTIALPYYCFKVIWYHVAVEGLTQYPNLNQVLGVVSIILYAILLITILIFVVRLFRKLTGQSGRRLFFYYLLPAVFALVWFLAKLGMNWLFTQ